jgi:hypothetical protein
VEGAVPAVGVNGEIYVTWAGPNGLAFQTSTDGGLTWLKKERIIQNQVAFTDRNQSRVNKTDQILFSLDEVVLKQTLATLHDLSNKEQIEIEIPNKSGVLEKFAVREFSNFDSVLQAQFPDIRAYAGTGLTDKNASVTDLGETTDFRIDLFRRESSNTVGTEKNLAGPIGRKNHHNPTIKEIKNENS